MVAPWVLCAEVVAAADVQRSEGRSVWLLVGLFAAVFVAVPIWIRYGGSKVGPLPFIPNDPVATIFSGQKIAFAAGDLAVGDSLLCENHGVLVGAKVPKPGHTSIAQFAGSQWTATVKVRMRDDGVVIARCA